ncbi:hypothetical protein [Pseudomonas sp. NPDC089569]|uniref:hypothetical protein n=1 Tax=Pseudomonas sp. NPDC089569 TaxID=3390722 RepID=UPI003CFD4146
MSQIQIMSVIGSAVPASLRASGLLACWYLVLDGEQISGPLTSLPDAQAMSKRVSAAQTGKFDA